MFLHFGFGGDFSNDVFFVTDLGNEYPAQINQGRSVTLPFTVEARWFDHSVLAGKFLLIVKPDTQEIQKILGGELFSDAVKEPYHWEFIHVYVPLRIWWQFVKGRTGQLKVWIPTGEYPNGTTITITEIKIS